VVAGDKTGDLDIEDTDEEKLLLHGLLKYKETL
jgi:hypothetical protein